MNPEAKLFSVLAGQPTYLVLSYRDGELSVYRDGKREPVQAAVRGDFRNWVAQHLLLGDEYADPRPWLGQIERFAVHSRVFVLPRDQPEFGHAHDAENPALLLQLVVIEGVCAEGGHASESCPEPWPAIYGSGSGLSRPETHPSAGS